LTLWGEVNKIHLRRGIPTRAQVADKQKNKMSGSGLKMKMKPTETFPAKWSGNEKSVCESVYVSVCLCVCVCER
jgi:hypothetical protein